MKILVYLMFLIGSWCFSQEPIFLDIPSQRVQIPVQQIIDRPLTAKEISENYDINEWLDYQQLKNGRVIWPYGIIKSDKPIYRNQIMGCKWEGCGRNTTRYNSTEERFYRRKGTDFTSRFLFTGPKEVTAVTSRACRGWSVEGLILEHANDGIVLDVRSDLGRGSNHHKFESVSFIGRGGVHFGRTGHPHNAADVNFIDCSWHFFDYGVFTHHQQNLNYFWTGCYFEQGHTGVYAKGGGNMKFDGIQSWCKWLLKIGQGGKNPGSYTIEDFKSDDAGDYRGVVDASEIVAADARIKISQVTFTDNSRDWTGHSPFIAPTEERARRQVKWQIDKSMLRGPKGIIWEPLPLSEIRKE